MIGQQVSRFRILSPLGAGAMGEVYLAEDLDLGRKVAIKFLARELLSDPTALTRFRQEARNAAELAHPGIAGLLEFGTFEERPYLVLEFVPGETLAARLLRGPLSVDEVLRVGRLLAEALDAAHKRGIIHRDIKPGNVMILPDGSPKLLDLGLSVKFDSTRLTRSGVIPGTIAYMSPEQLSGGPADERSDLWGLGVVLYECLVGRLPFEAESAIGTVTKVLTEELVAVREHRRGIPTGLDVIVIRCLQKDPALRFQHADEVAAQFRLLESQLRVPLLSGPTRRRERQPWTRLIVFVPLVLALVGLAAFAAWRSFVQGAPPRAATPEGQSAVTPPMVVLPFTGSGSESSQALAQGVRGLLVSHLDGFAATRCVDSRLVDTAVQARADAPDEDAGTQVLLDRLGATRLVRGSLAVLGNSVRLEARLTERSGGRSTSVTRVAEGKLEELPQVVERLARQLIAASFAGTDNVRLKLAALDTPPMDALVAFEAGSSDQSLASAADLYARATQADTAFALAWLNLASAQGGLGQADAAGSSFRRALKLAETLPRRDRLMLEAVAAAQEVDIDRAERCYRQVLAEYPDDAEAWFGLGDTLFRFNTLRGRRTLEAKRPLLESVRLSPQRGLDARGMLVRIGMATGDRVLVDSLYRSRTEPRIPGDGSTWAETWLAFSAGDTTAQTAVLNKSAGSTTDDLLFQMVVVGLAGDVDAALRLGELAIAKQAEPNGRANAQLMCAIAAVSGGRLGRALEILRTIDAVDSVYARSVGGLMLVSEFIPPSPARLDSLDRSLRRLERTPEEEERLANPLFRQGEGSVQSIRFYVLGMIAARMGRTAEAREFSNRLAHVSGTTETRVWASNFSLGIQSALDAREGHWQEVIAKLGRLSPGTKSWGRLFFHNLLQERFLYAEALRQSGDLEGALARYECMQDVFIVDHVYSGPCALHEAEICEKLGRRAEAIQHYRFLCRLWSHCDAEFRPVVEDARERIVRLEAIHG